MYIYIYICMYIYLFMYRYMYICICIYIYIVREPHLGDGKKTAHEVINPMTLKTKRSEICYIHTHI